MLGRGQGVGPCPNLVKAWIGEHYSETWSQVVQLSCPEVLATPPAGGLPGHGGKQLPYHLRPPMCRTHELHGLGLGTSDTLPPNIDSGSRVPGTLPGRRPGLRGECWGSHS